MIRFRVNGRPAPQGSKRHVGGGRMVESSRAVGPWREAVRAEAQRAWPRSTLKPSRKVRTDVHWAISPLSVTIVFVLPRPRSHYTPTGRLTKAAGTRPNQMYPAKRPDVDKLARAALDGLVMGGVMADDSQVVSLNVAKVYATNGEAPGALIEVEAMT